MAEDRQPDPADQPDDRQSEDQPAAGSAGLRRSRRRIARHRTGSGGGSSSQPPDQPNEPVNPLRGVVRPHSPAAT